MIVPRGKNVLSGRRRKRKSSSKKAHCIPPMPPTPTDDDDAPAAARLQSSGFQGLCLKELRGVRWRVQLGILPSSTSSSVEEFRRAVADCRRRYASLRHQFLVDPRHSKDGNFYSGPAIDNPLSENPDSSWVRFFKNTELEEMVERNLSRLYPEHGSFFQTPTCQAMLRRVLLLWCLTHPECGYKQGMHELLVPLLYVLHVDVQYLSIVRKKYEEHFIDELDGLSFDQSNVSNYRFTKSRKWDDPADTRNFSLESVSENGSVCDLDSVAREIIVLSDAYGSEGELGMVLSERFLEHDTYCIFNALMSGTNGLISVAELFSPTHSIEACFAIYHLLSITDQSIHRHLIALGVEPQYFGLRWLRVLFGREFSLENLLIIWDQIFSYPDNGRQDQQALFKILASDSGAFIIAMSVSMILHLRSSLRAVGNATSCLHKLLNFPENINVQELIEDAKHLQATAFLINTQLSSSSDVFCNREKLSSIRYQGILLPGSISPRTPPCSLSERYWEEKWTLFQKKEEPLRGSQSESVLNMIKGFCKKRLSLPILKSEPAPSKNMSRKERFIQSIRRRLLADFSQESAIVGHHADPDDGSPGSFSDISVTTEPNTKDDRKIRESSCIRNIEHELLDDSSQVISCRTSCRVGMP